MKIGLVCPYDLAKHGGVQEQVLLLRDWLDAEGHDVTVVGPASERVDGVVAVGGSVTVRANQSTAPVNLHPRVGKLVREAVAGVEVVHIHEPFLPAVGLAASRIKAQPTVGTFHADASRTVRRGLRMVSPIARGAARRLNVVTAVSPVARSVVTMVDDVRIIPNGVDTSKYRSLEKPGCTVVFLGRDDPRKGLDVALEAWPAIHEAHPQAELVVLGAHRDDPIDGLTFRGRVSDEEKQRVLGEAEVYMAPNLGGESFGIILVEAMAASGAVVASAIPAFAAVVGDAGVLVKPGDPRGLADAVIGLLGDEPRRRELQRRAQARATKFDVATVGESYLAAYRDAVRRWQNDRASHR